MLNRLLKLLKFDTIIKQELQFGSKTIEYNVDFSDRSTLGITVDPEMEVHVKVPHGTNLEKVAEKVSKKTPWILNSNIFSLGSSRKSLSANTLQVKPIFIWGVNTF